MKNELQHPELLAIISLIDKNFGELKPDLSLKEAYYLGFNDGASDVLKKTIAKINEIKSKL